jgi:hypothetical protein
MSRVTNAILCMGMLNDETGEDKEVLSKVNAFFGRAGRGFMSVDDGSLPRGWYGGTKMLECTVAIGAFNFLNLDALVQHLRGIDWPDFCGDRVQLLVKEPEDDGFRVIDVQPGEGNE